jgi:hypothetical protein
MTMYTEQRDYSLEGALGELDRRTSSLGRLEARLANVERLTEAAADVNLLLAVIADPKATKARLEAPQKATQELEAGRAQLAADREASVREAFRLMQDDPQQTLKTAAAAVGLNAYKLREALNRTHVRKWTLDERRLQLDAINAGNPEALRRLRDTTENAMATVGAIKTLEAM